MSGDTGNGDLLRASRSPQTLGRAGVRRLNYIPLFICGAIAVVVAVLIAWTAAERGKAVAVKTEDHGGSARDFALAVAGDKTGYIAPAYVVASPPPASPALNALESVPAATPAPNEEAEARKKAFFQALFASSAVSDPVLQQVSNAHQQAISAAQAAKAVRADPNNLGGATPADIADYQRQALAAQRLLAINGGQPPAPSDPNSLATYNGYRDRWKLNTWLEAPTTPYILRTGAIIPALLLSAMDAELPGTIIAQVSQDVYDTPTGNYLLIPQGSRLVGEYSNAIQYGQSRIFVAWQRIIYPDGSALDIGAMPGADQQGEAGFNDKVDNHFVRIFGSAILMSAVTAATNWATNHNQVGFNSNGYSASSAISEAVGQQLGQATAHLLEKNLSIAPTLTIRPGYRFNILAVKDLTFDRPYVAENY
jgi:type IV secretory pathway VirB10-like protein